MFSDLEIVVKDIGTFYSYMGLLKVRIPSVSKTVYETGSKRGIKQKRLDLLFTNRYSAQFFLEYVYCDHIDFFACKQFTDSYLEIFSDLL